MTPIRLRALLLLLLSLAWSVGAGRERKDGSSRLVEGSKGDPKKKNCEPIRLQNCMDQLQAINKDHNLAFASTEDELKKMCKTMESGLDCVHKHVSRCFSKNRQQIIYQLITGTEDVIISLCNQGEYREQYLLHSPCMRNISTDNQVCGMQYQRLISSVSPPDKSSFEDSIRQQCCAFHNYLLCVTSTAKTECGVPASNFIEEYTYRTAGPIIQTRCKQYVPGSHECTYSTAALSRAGSVLSLSFLLVVPLLFPRLV